MKNSLLKFAALLAIAFLYVGCEKEAPLQEEDILAIEEMTATTDYMNDADDEAAYKSAEGPSTDSSQCPVITFVAPPGTYPNTMTIDFGTEGCVGPGGRVRKGQIIVELSDRMMNEGAVRTITLQDFYVNDYKVEGNKTITNEGLNNDGQPFFTVLVQGGKITGPGGNYVTWNAERVRTLIFGGDTPSVDDDVYAITGGASGLNSNGDTFSSTIVDPLIKRRSCPWIVSGTREITLNGQTVRIIDYGNGDCDRKATLTLPNGDTRLILLKH